MKIFVGSDHAGFALKRYLVTKLQSDQWEFSDCGCHSDESCDYPEFGDLTAREVVSKNALGILVCGSGIGIGIAANKVLGARAAVVTDVTATRLSREHNDANIVCLGARLIGPEVALDICRTFLSSQFLGGRHARRIELLSSLEKRA